MEPTGRFSKPTIWRFGILMFECSLQVPIYPAVLQLIGLLWRLLLLSLYKCPKILNNLENSRWRELQYPASSIEETITVVHVSASFSTTVKSTFLNIRTSCTRCVHWTFLVMTELHDRVNFVFSYLSYVFFYK